jgi:hypothetical protein
MIFISGLVGEIRASGRRMNRKGAKRVEIAGVGEQGLVRMALRPAGTSTT